MRPDLVKRNFRASDPNRLWVADITYFCTRAGFVYTAFVTDVYSRKITGWATKSRLTTEALPLEALNHAITTAKYTLSDLVHHSDHGSVTDSCHNALVETINGLYKSELI